MTGTSHGGAHNLTVRVQTLDGQWETVGAGRYRGVVPENVSFTFNSWGPDTCSFVLRRDVAAIHPDLTTWTPIEIEIAGAVVWDGRLKETPTGEGDDPTISVQAEGWQYHLDDDVYTHTYVRTRLGGAVDMRSFAVANLNIHRAPYRAECGDGSILLMVPNGVPVVNSTAVAATIDLGPGNSAITTSIDAATSFNAVAVTFYVMGTDTPDWTDATLGGRLDWKVAVQLSDAGFGSANNTITLSTTSIATAKRYITFVLYWNAATGTTTADYWVKFSGMRAASSASYLTSGLSNLKADTVIKHALATAAPLLSADVSQIEAGTFSMPEFALEGNHTPREIINAVNAYENYEVKMLVGRKLSFQPRTSTAAYEIGEWSGAEFQDASANSGDEIYNRVIVEGAGPDGERLRVIRGSPGPPWRQSSEVIVPNPGFEVNTASWTPFPSIGGTITRDTATFNTGVASGRGTTNSTGTAIFSVTTPVTGFVPGLSYKAEWAYRRLVATLDGNFSVDLSGTGDFDNIHYAGRLVGIGGGAEDAIYTIGSWHVVSMTFTALATQHQFRFTWATGTNSQNVAHIDDFRVLRSHATLIDRREFTRTKILPVDSAITVTSGSRIGDLYLAGHKTVPFKGGFKATGLGGVRRVLGGSPVHPAHIEVGRMVRCSHRIDPDNGAWGRDGTIAAVTYDHNTLTSTVSLDENRAGLETLLGRLAVVQGQRRT